MPPKRVKKVMTLPINVIFGHLQVRLLLLCHGTTWTQHSIMQHLCVGEKSINFVHSHKFWFYDTDRIHLSIELLPAMCCMAFSYMLLDDAINLPILWNIYQTKPNRTNIALRLSVCRKKQGCAFGCTRTPRCSSRDRSSGLTNTWTWSWTTRSRSERNETRWEEFFSRGTQSRWYKRPSQWRRNNKKIERKEKTSTSHATNDENPNKKRKE